MSTPTTWCLDCGTPDLPHGTRVCQGCAVGRLLTSGLVPPMTIAQDAARASSRVAEMDAELAEYETREDAGKEVA